VKINNILGGLSDALPLNKRAEPAEASQSQSTKTAASAATSAVGTSPVLRQILAKYDVTAISPSEFSEMVQKLYNGGAISAQEYHELSAIRVDLEASGVSPDETVNLVELYRDKAQSAQRQASASEGASQQDAGAVLRRLDWMEKFSAIHAQPDSAGLNTLA
jgi:hypothetical protein